MNNSYSTYPSSTILFACEQFEQDRQTRIKNLMKDCVDNLVGKRRWDCLWLVRFTEESAIEYLGGDSWNEYNMAHMIWWRQAEAVKNLKLLAETSNDKVYVSSEDIAIIAKYLI